MQKHLLRVSKTARYFSTGVPASQAKSILFALHGYAQLANDFLNQLQPVVPEHMHVIAPEGLHRFYAKGLGGKPAASWMTSEERLSDIEDYVNYLNQLYNEVVPENFDGKIAILGFSQGVATASRWLANGHIGVHSFIMCSGDIAAELRNPVHQSIAQIPSIHYCSAINDPLLTDSAKAEVDAVLAQLTAEKYFFDGGHQLHLPTLQKIFLTLLI